jgi:hypothetical protein
MAVAYGTGITSFPLRHAIIAYATSLRPDDENFRRLSEIHRDEAVSSLIRKLDTPELIVDADVFAAYMLSWAASICQDPENRDFMHAQGCLTMLSHISSRGEGMSEFLAVFSGMMMADMQTVLLKKRPRDTAALTINPAKLRTFDDRHRYYKELCRTGTPPEAWCQDSLLENTHSYLRGAVLNGALNFLKRIAMMERDGLGRRGEVDNANAYITSKLDDAGFQRALPVLERSFRQRNIQHAASGDRGTQLLAYQFMGLDTLNFIFSIVDPENENILAGISSPNTRAISAQICSAALRHGAPAENLKYYADVYYCDISLAGLVGPTAEVESSTPVVDSG